MVRRRRPPRPGALTELPPLKILSQILLLQTIWYTCATILILFSALVAGKQFSMDMVFSWRTLRGDTTVGWTLGLVWMLNSFVGVIGMFVLISRSKLVPDFTLTVHFIHLVVTSLYSHSIPRNWLWWALQIASVALMASLGVWSCQYRELRPINFGGNGGSSSNTNHQTGDTTAGSNQGGAGDEEEAFERGRGRGRGRDGAGEYEMVGMKPEGEAS